MEPIEVIKNSNKAFVRQKYLIWNGGTDTQTHRQTDPYIELRYAQLIRNYGFISNCKFFGRITKCLGFSGAQVVIR